MIKIDRDFMIKVYDYADKGYITRRVHPDYPELWIYNYTTACVCDGAWDEVTLACRGLILSHNVLANDRKTDRYDVNVVARPFPKFFNYQEHVDNNWPIPNEPFEVTEKMDGSLGIIFYYDDKWHVATRGSFESEQANVAYDMLGTYPMWLANHNCTYLVEIIYPENRIVVNYGGEEKLVLLTVIDKFTNEEVILGRGRIFTEAAKYGPPSPTYTVDEVIQRLLTWDQKNREGVVLKFKSGVRIKVKFEQYIQLHRIITSVSAKRVWEGMRDGVPLTDAMRAVEDFPDEIYRDTRHQETMLRAGFASIEYWAKKYYNNNMTDERLKIFNANGKSSHRRLIADYFNKYKYPKILFCMLDGKDYSSYIWKLLKP